MMMKNKKNTKPTVKSTIKQNKAPTSDKVPKCYICHGNLGSDLIWAYNFVDNICCDKCRRELG